MTLNSFRLPARAISVRPEAVSTPRGYLFLTLLMLAIAGVLIWWEGPDLLQDWEISKHPIILDDGSIENGNCTTRRGVFTDCEAHLTYSYGGQSYEKDVDIFFVDLHVGDYESGMAISADHPEMATLTIGLDKLWNRIISFTAFVLIIAGIGIGMLLFGIRVVRARRQLLYPATLTPIPVEIVAFNRNRRGLFVNYADKLSEGKTNRSAYTNFNAGEEPLIIGVNDGKAVGLAVRHPKSSLPVLLDSLLQRLDLTDEERRTVLSPVNAQLAAEGGMIVLTEAKKKLRILRGLLTFVVLAALIIAGCFGYWLWYVTNAPSQFDQIGMEINNILPQAMNNWGCEQLKERFGNDRAPFGCVASDFTSWK